MQSHCCLKEQMLWRTFTYQRDQQIMSEILICAKLRKLGQARARSSLAIAWNYGHHSLQHIDRAADILQFSESGGKNSNLNQYQRDELLNKQ